MCGFCFDSNVSRTRKRQLAPFLPFHPLQPPKSHPAQESILARINAIQKELSRMTTKHLNQYELAKRWTISQRTLERWRWKKKGPSYLKIGGRVVYELRRSKPSNSRRRRVPQDAAREASS